jgi:hypothetical protein
VDMGRSGCQGQKWLSSMSGDVSLRLTSPLSGEDDDGVSGRFGGGVDGAYGGEDGGKSSADMAGGGGGGIEVTMVTVVECA